MRQSWAVWVPEGPGKNDQYSRNGSRRFLTNEALMHRGIVAAQLVQLPTLTGLLRIWVHHRSSNQGRDDFDHQSTALADSVTWVGRKSALERLKEMGIDPAACGGWVDDKQVRRAEIVVELVDLAESGVLLVAEEIVSMEELLS